MFGDVKFRGSLGCCDHEVMVFRILRAVNKAECMIITLDFRRADFDVFRNLLQRILWDMFLERRGL